MKNLKIKFGLYSLLTVLAVSVFFTSCEQEEILSDVPEIELENYELLTLNTDEILDVFKKQKETSLQLKIPYNNLNIELEEINIFDVDKNNLFYTIEKDGSKTPLEIPDIRFYGNKKGANEMAFLSVFEDNFRLEYTKEGKSFSIVPALDIFKDKHEDKYVAYASDELVDTNDEMDCFHSEAHDGNIDIDKMILETSKKAGFYKLRVGGVIDYAMYQYYGFNGAVNQVLNQVANAHQIFANNNMNIDIIWSGGYIDMYNTLQPTTETYYSQNFFNQWAAWATGEGQSMRAWNVDNFFIWTGQWLQHTGAMGATGYCCLSNYYTSGFMNIRKANSGGWAWKNRVLAHEIAHSLGAHHDSGIMAWNTASGTFSWNSKNQINNHLNNYSWCLHD